MIQDVNKRVENPKLKTLLNNFHNADQAHIAEAYEAIAEEIAMNASMLAVVHMDRDDLKHNNDGTATIMQGTKVSIEYLKDAGGRTFLPVFTDWDELRKWEKYKNASVQTFVMTFDDMCAFTKENCGIAVNPFSDNLVITVENVISMKRHKEILTKGFSEEVVKKETKVLIGDPANYPTAITDAIKRYAEKNKAIRAIWLKLMIKEGEKSYLLVVDADDAKSCFGGIAEAARPFNNQGLFLDMIPYADDFGKGAATGEPFYKRVKKGLFGIFK